MLHFNYPALVPINTYYSLIGAVLFVLEMFVILVCDSGLCLPDVFDCLINPHVHSL